MRLCRLFLQCVAFAVFALASHPVEVRASITLKDAFRSALEKTETVAIGQARIHQSEARIDQAASRFFPALSFNASYQQQDTSGVLSRQSSALFGGGQSYTRLTLSQSIYEGGRDLSLLRMNRSDREVQRQNLSVANYALFAAVAKSFYGVLSNEREVENLKVTISLAKDRAKEIAVRTQVGRSRNVEWMAAQAQLSVLEAQRMAAEGQLITAWDEFVLMTDLPRDVHLVKKREVPEPPQPVETYLALLEERPDIGAMTAQIESAKNNVGVARSGHLPSFVVSGNYYLTREGTQQGNDWDIGAALAFPLFSGGLVKAQVREANEKVSELEATLRQTKRQAAIAIRTAYNNLTSNLNQLNALQSAISSTEQNYREQAKNYRFGQATNLDVIQALNLFQDTKRSLDRTRYLALSAWAELKAATAQVSLADVTGGEL